MNRSVATIDSPEFINVTPYNPLISQCEIKVLYVGENRNRSFISKEVAKEMANSLPGCPIVGMFVEDKEDFLDHGQQITIDGEGVKFKTLTKPYGFVAPDAKIWFQKFEDTDDFGNTIVREYLMTTGFLWTGQYEEAQRVITKGNNQSMELDEKTLEGNWATNNNTGVEFFIINDAIFSKLAILGEDVEPCFEGASITAPEISREYALDTSFTHTLFSMMRELQGAIETMKGGTNMEEDKIIETPLDGTQTEFELEEGVAPVEPAEEAEVEVESTETEEDSEVDADADFAKDDEEKKASSKCELDPVEYQAMVDELTSLREFKAQIENEQKDALIASFYILDDEDKAEIIANKVNYSLEDIEKELAVICVRNRVNFDAEDDSKEESNANPITSFNLNEGSEESVPAIVERLRRNKKSE